MQLRGQSVVYCMIALSPSALPVFLYCLFDLVVFTTERHSLFSFLVTLGSTVWLALVNKAE